MAVGIACDTLGLTGPDIGVGGLLELGGPRRTGGERPRPMDDGSMASSFVKRSRSWYIFRVTGAEPCNCIADSSMGRPSLSACSSCVGVVTVVAVVGAGWTDWAEVWLTARVRKRDKMDGIAPLLVIASCVRLDFPGHISHKTDAYVPVNLTSSRAFCGYHCGVQRVAAVLAVGLYGPLNGLMLTKPVGHLFF